MILYTISSLWIFLWPFVIYPSSVQAVTSPCPPAEEYKPYTLTCPTNDDTVIWMNDKNGRLATCGSLSCQPTNPTVSTATWNSSFSTFTFKNMSRSNKFYLQEYSCRSDATDSQSHQQCRPGFLYARSDKPTCWNPLLSDTTVSLTCQTQKIFPQAGCQFYNQTSALHGTVTYINGTLNNMTTDYYQPQCTIELNLGSDIGPGVHQFKVLMYPDVPGGEISFGAESDLTSDINLALPSASLSTSCSNNVNMTDNYIKEGTTVTCQCNKAKDGNPPGWVEWVDNSKCNQPVSNTKDNTAILTVTAELGGGEGPDFICRGASNLGQELPGVPFKKEIAFGPSSLNILKGGIDNLCPPNPSVNLTVYSEIPVTNVKPEPVFTVSINNMSPISEINVTNTTHYRWKSEFRLTTSGKHQVTCLATNSEFSTIQQQDVISVEIRAPPTSEPLIRLANGKVVLNGETASVVEDGVITCYVEGGFPPANVTLTCDSGNNTLTVAKGLMEVSLKIPVQETETKCFCTAFHSVTACPYRKMSSFSFGNLRDKEESSEETAIVGGVLGGLLIITVAFIIVLILITKEKLNCCFKSAQTKLPDSETKKVDPPVAQNFMDLHQNEAFDGYEVPVTPHLSSDYENSLPNDSMDNTTITAETKPEKTGNVVYQNTV